MTTKTADIPLTEHQIEYAVAESARLAAPIFKRQKWTYFDSPAPPTQERIAEGLRDMVERAAAPDLRWSIWGHFIVQRFVDEMGVEQVYISLNLAHEWGPIDA